MKLLYHRHFRHFTNSLLVMLAIATPIIAYNFNTGFQDGPNGYYGLTSNGLYVGNSACGSIALGSLGVGQCHMVNHADSLAVGSYLETITSRTVIVGTNNATSSATFIVAGSGDPLWTNAFEVSTSGAVSIGKEQGDIATLSTDFHGTTSN